MTGIAKNSIRSLCPSDTCTTCISKGGGERIQVSVTHDLPGVTCVVVRETGIVDGVVTEDPGDDQAQNKAGSV